MEPSYPPPETNFAPTFTFDLQRFSKTKDFGTYGPLGNYVNNGYYWVEHDSKLKYINHETWRGEDDEEYQDYLNMGQDMTIDEFNDSRATIQSVGENNNILKLTTNSSKNLVFVDAVANNDYGIPFTINSNTTTIDASEAKSPLRIRLKTSGNTVKKVLGGTNADILIAGDGGVSISGGEGNDTIIGYTGNDYLDGGAGNDSLIGGGGSDTFAYSGGSDTIDGYLSKAGEDGEGKDTVILSSDFAAPTSFDKIDNSNGNFVLGFSDNNSLTFQNASTVELTKGNDVYNYTEREHDYQDYLQ